MQIVIRGADVFFYTTFKDGSGAVFTPSGAYLRVAYKKAGVDTVDTVVMTFINGFWTCKWGSKLADAGLTDWFVYTNDTTNSVDEGTFNLTKNRANPGT